MEKKEIIEAAVLPDKKGERCVCHLFEGIIIAEWVLRVWAALICITREGTDYASVAYSANLFISSQAFRLW
jgi:hypothetical protein